MPASRRLADPEVSLVLATFVQMVRGCFADRLVSVVLHGSLLFDDLAPGYGDLDFVVVVDADLSEAICDRLVVMRRQLRADEPGVVARMLEGAFLPRQMLVDPLSTGRAFWWGTSGERPWELNHLGWFCLHLIRERGVILWGEDVRRLIPAASRECLSQEVRAVCETMRQHATAGRLHSVDWLLAAARCLLWLREGRLASKTEAADWGGSQAHGTWRRQLPRAKQLRLHPSTGDSPEMKRWLLSLAVPIREAAAELELELMGLQDRRTERNPGADGGGTVQAGV